MKRVREGELETGESSLARLHVIFARNASKAVIFRRGPSKWTLLLTWDTKTDVLTPGDWHYGRIYELRCDLSPSGERLVYFCNSYKKATADLSDAWTAVSKPPSLFPIEAWPKGDCWHGGGTFDGENILRLNHFPEQAVAHPAYQSTRLVVTPNPNAMGEDDPVHHEHLLRDGWSIDQERVLHFVAASGFVTEQPMVLSRAALGGTLRWTRTVTGFTESASYVLTVRGKETVLPLAWADVDQRGRLIGTRDGALIHIRYDGLEVSEKLIADLNDFVAPRYRAPSWVDR
jgi:hypothetical protein